MVEGREPNDFYESPPGATQAFWDAEGHNAPPGPIWEPCAGRGAISKVLERAGRAVISHDLIDRGYCEAGRDFLQAIEAPEGVTAIITNPPYRGSARFVAKALDLATYSAFLLPLSWLESQGRYEQFFTVPGRAPARVYVHSDRQTLYRGDRVRPKHASGSVPYAWFVFDAFAPAGTALHWLAPLPAAPDPIESLLEDDSAWV